MAITYDATSKGKTSTAGTSLTVSHTIGDYDNCILVVAVLPDKTTKTVIVSEGTPDNFSYEVIA